MTSFQPPHPILSNPADWYIYDVHADWSKTETVKECWVSLLPFFAAKGYRQHPSCEALAGNLDERQRRLKLMQMNGPIEPKCGAKESYPFPRAFFRYKYLEESQFVNPLPSTVKCFLDKENRDVILKLVHGDELKILQYLNTPEMRANPRNRTIPVLEFITFEALTFAVMPRWQGGIYADYADVRQLMHVCDQLFEGLDFLHEHRIVHRDVTGENMAFNAVADPLDDYPTGLLDPSETEFVFIDFGISLIFPLDTVLDTVAPARPYFTFGVNAALAPQLPRSCNPFSTDVFNLVRHLQLAVRVAEDIVPEVVPFFEAHTKLDVDSNPSARETLTAFRAMYANIDQERLDKPVTGRYWAANAVETKIERPSETRQDSIKALQDRLCRQKEPKAEIVARLPLPEVQA
ncbi:hypothetical protein C8J56DRAFT_1028397 [Mycena floridula]|nr:hypothetical protein C8J56DRAFT_1028397 [Mycena floridula]